jgi:thymidylate synthase
LKQIHDLFMHVLQNGDRKPNRTGVDTLSVFGYQMRFDVGAGFPLVTGKRTSFKLIASELLWFLKGTQHEAGAINWLHAHNNHIWDEWVKEDGSFGPIYGVQWRKWQGVSAGGEVLPELDQIKGLIEQLKKDPTSRRMIVTAWQPAEIKDMALPPCHILFQLNARYDARIDGYRLDLQLYQRSCDCFLGVPFNVASYALLLELLCHCATSADKCFQPGELVWTGGDVHLYVNHQDQVREYLERQIFPLPLLEIATLERDIDKIQLSDLELINYRSGSSIKAEVAV